MELLLLNIHLFGCFFTLSYLQYKNIKNMNFNAYRILLETASLFGNTANNDRSSCE